MDKKKKKPETGIKKYKKFVVLFWSLFFLGVLSLALFIVGVRYFTELPDTAELRNPKTNLATEIYSSDLKVIGKYYAENRIKSDFEGISPNVINALIATEDARFYSHSGIDFRALARVFKGVITGSTGSLGGGSTVSQQLAKMLFPRERLGGIKTVIRKVKEWIIAVRLEREYTKEEILTMYLNKFDFVNGAVGIKSAAQIYFSTTSEELNVQQAAMLVGMAKNPSYFNPNRFYDRTLGRRNTVLNQMEKYGYLEEDVRDSLQALPLDLEFNPESHSKGLAPYFREYLRDVFLKKWCKENLKPDGTQYNIYRDGLKIYTTLDSRLQTYAETAVTGHMKSLQKRFSKELRGRRNGPFATDITPEDREKIIYQGMRRSERYRNMKKAGIAKEEILASFDEQVPMTIFSWNGDIDTVLTPRDSLLYYKSFLQAGFMSMDPHSGHVKAWVGGIDHKYFKYDHVQLGHRRQVGSTFKPFVYALAIQEGQSPCYQVPNVEVCIPLLPGQPDWCPKNSDKSLDGEMISLQKALANSVNFISAFLIKKYKPEAVVRIARRMGIVSPLEAVPSICLGTPEISVYEMVGANSTFANKGTWLEPVFITRIEDKNGNVLAGFSQKSNEVLTEEKAYVMLKLMEGVVKEGTGVRLRYKYGFDNAIAGKTGTTQNHSDGWFMGITPDLVSGCWTGAEDRAVHFSNIREGQGANMALPIWAEYMKQVYADTTLNIYKGDFRKPDKPVSIPLDCEGYKQDAPGGNGDTAEPDFG